MKARKFLLLLAISLMAAIGIRFAWQTVPYEEQLIRIQVKQELGSMAATLQEQPIDIQALFLDYAGNEELVLKARLALMKYPEKARVVLPLYGTEPEFMEILISYGETIVPVIYYFWANEVASLNIMSALGQGMQILKNADFTSVDSAANAGTSLWRLIGPADEDTDDNPPPAKPTPEQRGWYAVHFIKEEGHGFLGQFVIDRDGQVKWVQSERVLEGLNAFFASGIHNLETKHVLGEEIGKGDVFWAAVDTAVMAGTLKILRAGRAVARSGKQWSFATRTRLLASGLLANGGRMARTVAKYGAVPATIYILIMHPSALHSALGQVATFLGLSPWIVQLAGWSAILLLVLYPVSWLLKIFIRPMIWMLNLAISFLSRMQHDSNQAPPGQASVGRPAPISR